MSKSSSHKKAGSQTKLAALEDRAFEILAAAKQRTKMTRKAFLSLLVYRFSTTLVQQLGFSDTQP